MTSLNSLCNRPLGLMNLWSPRSPGLVQGDLAKANIIHISPSDHMNSIDQQCTSLVPDPPPLNPHYKKDPVSNPAWGTDKYKREHSCPEARELDEILSTDSNTAIPDASPTSIQPTQDPTNHSGRLTTADARIQSIISTVSNSSFQSCKFRK